MKKLLAIFLTIFSIFLLSTSASALKPTEDFYVNDYAGLLSEETKQYIMENSVKLHEQTKAQIVVITIESLEGRPLEEYATQTFREFGIGDKDLNNGVMMLLALKERKSRIEVGYGLEGALPDGKTGRIQDDYMIPFYKENKFDKGILNGYKALYREVANEYKMDSDIKPELTENSFLADLSIVGFMTKIVGGFVAIFIEKKSRKSRKI